MARKNKPGAGRPKLHIDWKIFEGLCSIQCTQEEICNILSVSRPTLHRACIFHYGENFEQTYAKKSANGKASMRRKMLEIAHKGNVTMLIWLSKNYLGMTDKTVVNSNEPIQVSYVPKSKREKSE